MDQTNKGDAIDCTEKCGDCGLLHAIPQEPTSAEVDRVISDHPVLKRMVSEDGILSGLWAREWARGCLLQDRRFVLCMSMVSTAPSVALSS